jgi:hypothetical protein
MIFTLLHPAVAAAMPTALRAYLGAKIHNLTTSGGL